MGIWHFGIYLDNFHKSKISGTMHTCDINYNNKISQKYFNFFVLNIDKMKHHWDQIGQHVTCPTKHKCKSKNQKLPYQQA